MEGFCLMIDVPVRPFTPKAGFPRRPCCPCPQDACPAPAAVLRRHCPPPEEMLLDCFDFGWRCHLSPLFLLRGEEKMDAMPLFMPARAPV